MPLCQQTSQAIGDIKAAHHRLESLGVNGSHIHGMADLAGGEETDQELYGFDGDLCLGLLRAGP